MLSEAIPETPETMREKLQQFREIDPDSYREMCHRILPVDALPCDADRQLEVISDIMLGALTRLARKQALAKLPH